MIEYFYVFTFAGCYGLHDGLDHHPGNVDKRPTFTSRRTVQGVVRCREESSAQKRYGACLQSAAKQVCDGTDSTVENFLKGPDVVFFSIVPN